MDVGMYHIRTTDDSAAYTSPLSSLEHPYENEKVNYANKQHGNDNAECDEPIFARRNVKVKLCFSDASRAVNMELRPRNAIQNELWINDQGGENAHDYHAEDKASEKSAAAASRPPSVA